MFQELSTKHPHFKVINALSEMKDNEPWDGETGFSVDKYLPDDLRGHQAFLCGPPPMIDAVTEVLLDKNLKPEPYIYRILRKTGHGMGFFLTQ